MPTHYQNFQTFLHSITNDVWQDDKLFFKIKELFKNEVLKADEEMRSLDYPKPTLIDRELGMLNLNCPGCD